MMMMMASKMKRKELEEVNDDFSDFSLSSPARKIRRLPQNTPRDSTPNKAFTVIRSPGSYYTGSRPGLQDVELPPIMEEEEPEIFPVFEQYILPQENVGEVGGGSGRRPPITKELPQKNEERAIVVFKSVNNTPFLQSPSAFSVSSDILAGLKNQAPWSNQSKLLEYSEDKAEGQDKILGGSNECLAVVPWVQSQLLPPTQRTLVEQPDVTEMMEGEEMDTATSMDIEDNYTSIEQRPGSEFGGTTSSEGGLHQWQQHCMVPQLPQNASPPIVWCSGDSTTI